MSLILFPSLLMEFRSSEVREMYSCVSSAYKQHVILCFLTVLPSESMPFNRFEPYKTCYASKHKNFCPLSRE